MTTENFSIESVEHAAVQAIGQQLPDQNAVNFLNQWESDPNSIFQACQILQNSANPYARFFSVVNLDHKIPFLWKDIDKENRINIRNLILQQIPNSSENMQILDCLMRSLAHIAVFDVPEEWEGYEAFLIPEKETFYTFLLLESFFTEVENSDRITEQRRQKLRSFLVRNAEIFLPRIQTAIREPETAKQAMRAYNAMVKWSPYTSIDFKDIDLICNVFLPQTESVAIATDCLMKIFVNRTDSHKTFAMYHQLIMHSLANIKTPTGHSVTNYPAVIKLVICIFAKYMRNLEKWIVKTGNNQLKNDLSSLLTTLLSLRESIPKRFWLMWLDIFSRIVDQNFGMMPDFTRQLFGPLIGMIRTNLYEMLPFCIEDGILLHQTHLCWAKLIEVDYQAMVEFMGVQSPSAALSYSLGCMLSVRAPVSFMDSFSQIIAQLNAESRDKLADEENGFRYLIPLLFGLSRSAELLKGMDLFDNFFDLTIECLKSSQQRLSSAASRAILDTVEKFPDLFVSDSSKLNELVQMAELYIVNLEIEAAIRMFKAVNRLIQNTGNENRNNLGLDQNLPAVDNKINEKNIEEQYGQLYYPLVQAMQSSNGNFVESSLMIVSETVKGNIKLAQMLIPTVSEIARNIIPNNNASIDSVELLLNALSSLINNFTQFNDVAEIVGGVLSLFLSRGQILGCYFTFIANLRKQMKEDMNIIFEEIMGRFVYPMIPLEPDSQGTINVAPNTPLAEILVMIAKFTHTQINIEWIVKVCMGTGIPSYEEEINKGAAKAIYRVFREMETPKLRLLFSSIGSSVFIVIFQALSDSMHKKSFEILVKLFMKLCMLLMNMQEFPNELSAMIHSALCSVFQEPKEGIFREFINYVGNAARENNYRDIADGFADFLIINNKMSPGDGSIFRVFRDSPSSFLDHFSLFL